MSRVKTAASSVELVGQLRAKFNDVRHATHNAFQNFQIRVHRSLSWLERALQTDPDEHPEGRLLYGWIAFNALYGHWDDQNGLPAKDREGYRKFLGDTLSADRQGLLANRLVGWRDVVLRLLDNQYLDPTFWRNNDDGRNARRVYYNGQSLYVQRRWTPLLLAVMDRIYVLRGQLVHGAATRGGSLNRQSLRQGIQLLEAILPAILEITIATGAHDNWPPVCYSPIREDAPPGNPPATRRPR